MDTQESKIVKVNQEPEPRVESKDEGSVIENKKKTRAQKKKRR